MNLSKSLYSLFISILILHATCNFVIAQDFDLLLKNGHVIDPKNNIDSKMDVAITGNKIVLIASNVDVSKSKKVINVSGLYVSPGFIDLHVHVFAGTNKRQAYMDGPNSLPPDGFTFRAGVTTVVDAGSSGWKTFPLFKKNIIDQAKTRVLAFLHIVGDGMGENEQDTKDMDPYMAAYTAKYYNQIIVGFKVAHFNGNQWTPIDSAVKAGQLADMPVMLDLAYPSKPSISSIEDLFTEHLRSGDIFTHMYRLNFPFYEGETVKPAVFDAQRRGILFDVGHGGNGFTFARAAPSVKQGFLPYSISSDLHIGNMNAGMKDMSNIMSKFLAMGMSLKEVISRSTWNPAKAIKREELGNLSVGTEADIAVFSLRNGNLGFLDSHNYKLKGSQKLETELTIRAGKVVWDLNGIAGKTEKESIE